MSERSFTHLHTHTEFSMLDGAARVRITKLSHQRLCDLFAIVVENSEEQSLLVAKGGVNAASIYPGRRDQVANRGTLVTTSPEQGHRAIKHFSAVELFYTRHYSGPCWNNRFFAITTITRREHNIFIVDLQHQDAWTSLS